MEKLIFVYEYANEPDYVLHQIPFEYSSKYDFIYEVLEDIIKVNNDKNSYYVNVFDLLIKPSELHDLESMVMTLDEWFDKYKEVIK